MSSSEIFKRASESKLLGDPYVEKVWELIGDASLFRKSPDFLESLRRDLLRSSLDFFRRHSIYYAQLFERLQIDPKSAEFADLAKLAVPADMLRGDGHKQFLIDCVEPGGEYFMSSGTTGKDPVKVYRSPLDLAIMIKANTYLFESVYGSALQEGKGIALFMAAPELRHRLSFVAFVQLTLDLKRIELIYGMDLVQEDAAGSQWQKLVPNKERILKFLKSKAEPKLLFTAPAGVYLLSEKFEKMNFLKRIMYKLVTGTPPISLGRGGVIVTGGGTKGYDLPPYDEIVSLSRKYFTAKDLSGTDVPVPFMDVLGMTETLTALLDKYGTVNKIPHPLSEVFLLDPKTYEVMDEDGKEGVLGIFNPFVTSWLETFYPGDLVTAMPSKSYYGREFKYVRRFTVEEGWGLQRACGGTMEEMMRRGQARSE
ncbi:MAG: hypothetical protein QFX35_05410 [Candidatus Verstraetearchaeota archaeon]|nr:hypothetical protein [Candidatus Verstraetearchaeota archaeon]